MNTDTPLPPDEPAGQNPPDGAIINYWLKAGARAPVTLEIRDAAGRVVRRYSSEDATPPVTDEGNVPAYWIRPPAVAGEDRGMHRFVWDLHYPPPADRRVLVPDRGRARRHAAAAARPVGAAGPLHGDADRPAACARRSRSSSGWTRA